MRKPPAALEYFYVKKVLITEPEHIYFMDEIEGFSMYKFHKSKTTFVFFDPEYNVYRVLEYNGNPAVTKHNLKIYLKYYKEYINIESKTTIYG